MKKFLHRSRLIMFFLLTFCFLSFSAMSQTLYVNDGSTVGDGYTSAVGNDITGSGSQSSPYATIAKAMSVIATGTIYVDAGTYPLSAPVTIKTNVKLIGICPSLSIVSGNNNNNNSLILSSNSELSKFTITRQVPAATNGPTSTSVATTSGGTNMKINNCFFTKCRTGIYVNGTLVSGNPGAIIENNDFRDNRTGILFADAVQVNHVIKGNNIINNRTYGVIFLASITTFSNILFQDNNFYGNLAAQIEVNGAGGAGAVSLVNNWFGTAVPVVNPITVNGGFAVDDHNTGSPYPYNFTDNNGATLPNYPNDISGSNTTAFNIVSHAASANAFALSGCCVVTSNNPVFGYPTIQAAINGSNPGATITLCAGATYDEQVLVNKSVTIMGNGATVKYTGVVSGKPTLFDVSVPDVTIENVQMDVDLVKLSSGIIASGVNISNLTIKNNTINAVASSLATSFGAYGNRNAVSVNYVGPINYKVAAGGVNNVRYEGNTVTGFVQPNVPSPIARYFRSGISLDEGGGTFTGNTSQAINHDVLVRFGSNGPVTVTNNICNGGGIELDDMNAGAGLQTVTGNTFNASFANVAAPGAAVLRLRDNFNAKTTIVSGNTFSNHQWAISMENYNSVTVKENVFTPLAGSTTFHHVTVNTKLIASNSSTVSQVTIAADVINNIFNGSGSAGGSGVTFLNHDMDAASFGAFNVNENSFDLSIANAIEQDGQSGPSTGATFPVYTSLIFGAGAVTTMAPWTAAINGTCNWYGTLNSATIDSKVGPDVAYIQYLSDGTDNSGDHGFQPVAGSCNGSNVLIITCPADMSVECASEAAVNVGSVTTTGTCPGIVVTHMGDEISNQTCANRYTITRTYEATDACGNTATCTQTITVNDITPPTITCPPNQTVAPTTLTGAVVTYPTPAVSDNCAGVGAAVRTAGPASGSLFPIGTTTITYQVTDACGNTATCSFSITVGQLPYCDNKQKKVYMCHNGTTICVSLNSVQTHLNHGDYLGQCTSLRSIVNVEPVSDEFRVNVSPNPSAGAFRIQVISKSIEPISVRVMDLSGKVLTVNSNAIKNSIVLGNELKPGTYLAEVIQGTSRQVIKLVKVN